MTTPTFRTHDDALRVAPVGSPLQSEGHQVLRAFVEYATPSAPFRIGQELALRAPVYQDRWSSAQHQERRDLLRKEAEYAALLYPELEAHILDIVTESGDADALLATRWLNGQSLERHIQAIHPNGAPLPLGLKWMRQIATSLNILHEQRLVHRNVNPQNIFISESGDAYLLGFASIQPRQTRPTSTVVGVHESYSAPEIIRELSGTFVTPKVDVFSMGAVMSFTFSGLALTDMVEAPVTVDAWSRLSRYPDGVRLLIAHCMQPFHKNRLVNAGALLPLLEEEGLPTKFTKNFGAIYLAAPWTGSSDESRIGDLSPGPLVSRLEAPDFDDLDALPRFEPQNPPPGREAPQPLETSADAAEPAPQSQLAPADAPFFARRGIPPLTIVFLTILLALAVLFLSQFFRA